MEWMNMHIRYLSLYHLCLGHNRLLQEPKHTVLAVPTHYSDTHSAPSMLTL